MYRQRRWNKPEPRAVIRAENGVLVLDASYDEALIAWLKAIPTSDRSGDKIDGKFLWYIDPKHGTALQGAIQRYMGLTVALPAVSTVEAPQSVQAFQVRYLGGAYARGAEERTASGWVGSQQDGKWLLIFGETALRKWFGEHDARPGDMLNHYGVLGVASTVDMDAIRKAYRKMAVIWHPDRNHDPDAQKQFIAIQKAYEVLYDDIKRQKYDSGLQLQASIGGERKSTDNVYFSPLRCGVITATVKPITGNRYMVIGISKWDDIVEAGRMLVPTWEKGAKMFLEQWVEVVR